MLVLQGGGALGAYQAGVYEALAKHDILPDWVTGISIGANNSALIAGNPPERRVQRLREFWDLVSSGDTLPAPEPEMLRTAFQRVQRAARGLHRYPGILRAPGSAAIPAARGHRGRAVVLRREPAASHPRGAHRLRSHQRGQEFTERNLTGLPLSSGKPYEIVDESSPWFICRIGKRTRTLYVRRKRFGSYKLVYFRLGVVGDRPLGQFRAEAEQAAASLASGRLPGTELPKRGTLTLQAAFSEYLASHKLAASTRAGYEADFRIMFRSWASRPLASLDPQEVLQRHKERSVESPAWSNQSLKLLRAVWRYAIQTHPGVTFPDPLALVSASRAWNRIERKRTVLREVDRIAWVRAVCSLPDDGDGNLFGSQRDALLLLITTGCRMREVLHARWSEVDLRHGVITIPGERTKSGLPHELPLPKRMLEMLRRRKQNTSSEYVFASVNPSLGAILQIRDMQSSFFANASHPSVILASDMALSAKQVTEIKEGWRVATTQAAQGSTPVLSHGLKPISPPVHISATDASLVDALRFSVGEVARCYGVPLSLPAETTDVNYAQSVEESRSFVSSCLAPWCARVASAFAEKLLSPAERAKGISVEFDLAKLTRGSGREEAEYFKALVSGGILTANEARNELGFEDADGGDELAMPLNSAPASIWATGPKAKPRSPTK